MNFLQQLLLSAAVLFSSVNIGECRQDVLPTNPCTNYRCPPEQTCQLIRRGCLPFMPCSPSPSCVRRPPSYAPGREDDPTTLQISAHDGKGGNRLKKGAEKPDFIKVLVKGLSTPQVVQKPFVEKTGMKTHNPISISKTRAQARQDPLVFLSQKELQGKMTNNKGRKKQDRILDLFQALRNVKPFFRLKGPGLNQNTPNKFVDVNFLPTERKDGPDPAYKAVYDTEPWKDFEVVDATTTKNKEPLYKKAMTILEKTPQKKKVIMKHDGFQPQKKKGDKLKKYRRPHPAAGHKKMRGQKRGQNRGQNDERPHKRGHSDETRGQRQPGEVNNLKREKKGRPQKGEKEQVRSSMKEAPAHDHKTAQKEVEKAKPGKESPVDRKLRAKQKEEEKRKHMKMQLLNMEKMKNELRKVKVSQLSGILGKVFQTFSPSQYTGQIKAASKEPAHRPEQVPNRLMQQILSPIVPHQSLNPGDPNGFVPLDEKTKMDRSSNTAPMPKHHGPQHRQRPHGGVHRQHPLHPNHHQPLQHDKQVHPSNQPIKEPKRNTQQEEETATTQFEFDLSSNMWPKATQIDKRFGEGVPQFEWESSSPDPFLEIGRAVPESYKMDANRRPLRSKHRISLQELDAIRDKVENRN